MEEAEGRRKESADEVGHAASRLGSGRWRADRRHRAGVAVRTLGPVAGQSPVYARDYGSPMILVDAIAALGVGWTKPHYERQAWGNRSRGVIED